MVLHENFTTDVSVDKEELIKFWKSFASGSGSRLNIRDGIRPENTATAISEDFH